jgi:hypothetical protein
MFALLIVLAILTLACSCLTTQQPGSETQIIPSPTIVPSPVPQVLFQDDFSNNNSGWASVVQDYKITDYAEGAYRMWVDRTQFDVWSIAYQYFEGDVSVEVEATKVGGPDVNDFGVICRYQEDETGDEDLFWFYFFIISSDGNATIAKVDGSTQTYLSNSGNMEYSPAIHTGNATNRIRADCIGSTLTLYVNGQQVMSVVDTSYSGGDVGLIAGTFDEGGVDILFDDFVVTRP